MINEANEEGCLEKFAAFPISLILVAISAIDFSAVESRCLRGKLG